MRHWRLIAIMMLAALAGIVVPALAQSADSQSGIPAESWSDAYPWLKDFVVTILAVALLCVLIYLFRPAGAGGFSADFTIDVDGSEVTFKGRFPPQTESTVEEFLLNDCRIEGRYRIMGKWDESRLVIAVRGENAKPLEQRIRNFLKLNVKKG